MQSEKIKYKMTQEEIREVLLKNKGEWFTIKQLKEILQKSHTSSSVGVNLKSIDKLINRGIEKEIKRKGTGGRGTKDPKMYRIPQ